MRRQKIWVGIGAFVVAGTAAAAAPGVSGPHPDLHGATTAASAAMRGETLPATGFTVAQHGRHGGERSERSKSGGEGEGGEGGEGGSNGLAPDISFALRIAQMRGHLLVGDQLVKDGQWAAAMPHFLHPAEELYGGVRRHLKTYNTPPFEAALKTLSNLVKRRKAGKDYDKALKVVQDAFAAADAGLKAKQSNWPGFTVETSLELVKSAAGEYEAAIENGRIAKPVEYQDARGFILTAEKMIDSVASDLEKKDAQAFKQMRASLSDIRQIFPSAMPPKAPVKDYGTMLGEVSRIELVSNRLM